MDYEKDARRHAIKYGYTIRSIPYSEKWPNGYVKIVDGVGNHLKASDMYQAVSFMRTFAGELLDSPIYEVGLRGKGVYVRVAARSNRSAKQRFCQNYGKSFDDPDFGIKQLEARLLRKYPAGADGDSAVRRDGAGAT